MSDENVVVMGVSAAAVHRMARAVESVDWLALAEAGHMARMGSLNEVADMIRGAKGGPPRPFAEHDWAYQLSWIVTVKAIYAEAAKHIIAAACEVEK